MPLLKLERVSKRFRCGGQERVALVEVSLEVEAGEAVGVVGRRRSGRTTLLEVAAGIELPSEGSVSFDDVPLVQRAMLGERGGIAFVTTDFPEEMGSSVVEQVGAPLLGAGATLDEAHVRAHEALRRVGASATLEVNPRELDATEAIRVGLGRALVSEPSLVLVDDPMLGVRLSERDEVLELLCSIAHRDRAAIVMTLDDASELAGCDRAATLDAGELRGETLPTSAAVIPFELRRSDFPA